MSSVENNWTQTVACCLPVLSASKFLSQHIGYIMDADQYNNADMRVKSSKHKGSNVLSNLSQKAFFQSHSQENAKNWCIASGVNVEPVSVKTENNCTRFAPNNYIQGNRLGNFSSKDVLKLGKTTGAWGIHTEQYNAGTKSLLKCEKSIKCKITLQPDTVAYRVTASSKDVLKLGKTTGAWGIHTEQYNAGTKSLLKCEKSIKCKITLQPDTVAYRVTAFNRKTEMAKSCNGRNGVYRVVLNQGRNRLSRNSVEMHTAGAGDGKLSREYFRDQTKIGINGPDKTTGSAVEFELECDASIGRLVQAVFSRCKIYDIVNVNSKQHRNNNEPIDVTLVNVDTGKRQSSMFMGFIDEIEVKLSRRDLNSNAKFNWANVINFGVSGINGFIRCPELCPTTTMNGVEVIHKLTGMAVTAGYYNDNYAQKNTRHPIRFGVVSTSQNKEFHKRVI